MKRITAMAAALVMTTALAPAPLSAFGERHSEEDAKAAKQSEQVVALGEAVQMADIWLEQYRQYRSIPALSVAVVNDQQTVWAKGFGYTDWAKRQAASADTIYSICSISKLFTAVAFMQQWEKGAVRLDEPVSTYLPWAHLAPDDRDSVPITMRGLLTHSAGLPREAVNPYWTGPDFPFPSQQEIRDGIGHQDLLYPAATTFQYSNLGLTLVGETVEAVSGTPYGEYVTTNILQPLKMEDTRPFIPSDLFGKQMAVGWGALTADGERPRVKLFDAKGINPAAGYSSTVRDLAKFAQWQFRLLESEQPELLRASTLRDMHRVHYITPDRRTSWGLGFVNFQIDGKEVVGHGGSCPGYRSSLLIDPNNQYAIAIAMNAMDNPGYLGRQLAAILSNRIGTHSYDAPTTEVIDLAGYAGAYDGQPWGADFFVVPWAGGLASFDGDTREPIDDMTRMKPLGGDRFRVVTRSGEERDIITFHRNADGRVTHVERFGQFNFRKATLE